MSEGDLLYRTFTGVSGSGDSPPTEPVHFTIDRDHTGNWEIVWTWLDSHETKRILVPSINGDACAWLDFLFSSSPSPSPSLPERG